MGTCQIITIMWLSMSFTVNAINHGKPLMNPNYNLWKYLFRTGILLTVLICGGFFK